MADLKYNSITSYLLEKNKDLPTVKWLNIKENNSWRSFSLDDFKDKVIKTACYLRETGVKRGSLVGIIAIPSPQWLIFDQAIMILGAVSVPLFPNASHDNLSFILEQTGMKHVFCYSDEAMKNILPFLRSLKYLLVYDLKPKKIPKDAPKDKIKNIGKIVQQGKSLLKKNGSKVLAGLKKIKPADLATIVYTSGSLGVPKGVMLSHGNIINQINGCEAFFPINPLQDRVLTFLPFAHIFERAIIYYYLSIKVPVYFSPHLSQIGNIIREIKPTFMTTVPRLLHKIYEKIYFNVKNSSKFKNFLARNAIRQAENKEVGSKKTFLDNLFDKLVYSKLRESLGGKHRCLVSGGAALDRSLYRFFYNIGIPIREGYGLTETSPVISANKIDGNQPYSVGLLFPNVKVKIARDGEVLTKGPSVMMGYFKNSSLTKSSFAKDGWFKTGDIGKLEKGFLFINSRKKELFKNTAGKYITPVPIESALAKNPYIDNAMVIADNKKFVTALLFLSQEHKGKLSDEELNEEISKLVSRVNQKLNPWERVIRFKTSWDVLSIDNGDLTPKMSIRRNFLLKKYKKSIDGLYRN